MDEIFIFSKKGDKGQTCLLSGQRVSKADLRPEAYGALDEASSALGLAKAFSGDETIREMIRAVQEDLLVLGAQLAVRPDSDSASRYEIGTERTERLESWIEQLQMKVPLPRKFILPGGNKVGASLDLARTIVRRAERRVTALSEAGKLDSPEAQAYLNRLSDFLFTLARFAENG